MIVPICIYGHPSLRKKTRELSLDYPHWNVLLNNLFETMYHAQGIGIAAPQIGLELRVFVVDVNIYADKDPQCSGLKKVFINPFITERSDENVAIDEGCLSIPNIHEKVQRSSNIRIQYTDEKYHVVEEYYEGFPARVIQHEYDHLEGILFTDHIRGIRKQMIRSKLNKLMNRKTKGSL